MLRAQVMLIAGTLAIGGCATSARQDSVEKETQAQKSLGERIQRICALPATERSVEIEKLKSESGFVLYCGK